MKPFVCLGLLGAFALCPAAFAQTDHAASLQSLENFHFGDDASVLDTVTQWVEASRSDPERRRQAARELTDVLTSAASFDAKQFACRQLILIAGEEQVPALIGLLPDQQLAHYAAMVLTRIPGTTVDAALQRALISSKGRAQIEIIDAIGERHDADATASLTTYLTSVDPIVVDPIVVEAAASALGKIGSPLAAQALQRAYQKSTGGGKVLYGRSLLECADRLRAAHDSIAAMAIYELLNQKAAGADFRAAALRGIVQTRGIQALPQLLEALKQDGSRLQLIAVALTRELPGRAVTLRLCESLPKLSNGGQLLLIAALTERGDASATPTITALTRSADSAVRMAALSALGAIGDASTVPALLEFAAIGPQPQRAVARDALARLRPPAVNARLLSLLDSAPPLTRVEIISALGQRRVAAVVPHLLREISSRQPAVSAAAVRVLRELGGTADLPALLKSLPSLLPAGRVAAGSAVVEIARRGADENARSSAVLTELSRAAQPVARAELLSIVGQIGGPRALRALRGAVTESNAEIRLVALRRLADWPTDEPMDDLLRIVHATTDEKQRTLALRGYIRMIGLSNRRTPAASLALLRAAALLSKTAPLKRLILAGIARQPSRSALEYAAGWLADGEVRAEAELAMVEIGRSTAGAWRDQTRASLEPLATTSANESTRNAAREVLARIDKMGDFVTAWEVSPAYERADTNSSQLFDVAFAPEQPQSGAQVAWRLMPAGTDATQPWLLDLLALWGGEQRVAYLRSAVWSEATREVNLELGSDDGVKAWWNGQVVLSSNVQRAVAPAQEKVKLSLQPGWNQLLLKITQNNQGWGACARFSQPDGAPITDLRYSVPSAVAAMKSPL